MKNTFHRWSAQLAGSLLALAACFSEAAAAASEDAALAHVRQAFTARFPSFPLEGVATTPFPGLYELHIGGELIYTNAQVDYLMQGSLIDAQSRTDLTEQRQQALNHVAFSELPLELAIRQVHGSGTRQIVLFEDPNCGYCKMLQKTLTQVDDITIYTFLFPILSEDSAIKARNIWCASNRTQVWQDWMRQGMVPATAECDNTPMSTLLALGKKMRVRGTPEIIFADGSQVSGALPLKALEEKLDRVEKTLRGG